MGGLIFRMDSRARYRTVAQRTWKGVAFPGHAKGTSYAPTRRACEHSQQWHEESPQGDPEGFSVAYGAFGDTTTGRHSRQHMPNASTSFAARWGTVRLHRWHTVPGGSGTNVMPARRD